jgi:hypothetical protein
MARLFKRAAAVTLAKPTSFFAQEVGNAIVVRDLHVRFEIEKHLGSDPNTCTLMIDNLAERTRAAVQVKPLHVRVDAGYDGEVARLFTGDLRFGSSMQTGPGGTEWTTTLQVADGDRANRFARVSRSYRAGVDVRTAVTEAARALGLEVPRDVATSPDLARQFAAGLTLHGNAASELTRLLDRVGLSWSVQDGQLVILSDSSTTADRAIVLSNDLIGSPELGAPLTPPTTATTSTKTQAGIRASGKPILNARCLLHPGITPGRKVKIEAAAIKGVFKVRRVVHRGDTHGSEWTTEIEATPV